MSKNETKAKIIAGALRVFTEKGFLGASMSQIAKAAQVNQSLIYHHFESKEDLWVHVKQYCIDEGAEDWKPIRYDTLENFVNDLVDVRFSVYARESMRMLVHWQALEPDPSKFYGNSDKAPQSPFNIAQYIRVLQKKKIVRTDQDPQVLAAVVFGLASYTYFDFADAYSLSVDQKDSYKKLVCSILVQALEKNRESDDTNTPAAAEDL